MLAMRAALDEVGFGVVLLDSELRAQFINRAFRRMWRLPDAKADSKPAFVALMYHGRDTRAYQVPKQELDSYIANRVALIKAGDLTPLALRLANGEVIRLNCAILPNGGRMLSYTYVTDIVRHSDELEVLKDALDHLHEGIVLLDPELNATFMNRAVRDL
jgi:PAS domain-containing protein